MLPGAASISWQVVALVLAVVGGATFLGYEKVLDGQTVGTLFGAVISAALVGHFATKGNGGGP